MAPWLVKSVMSVLIIALLMALLFWAFRFMQYRKQVQLSQARWLTFEPGQVFATEQELGMSWPMLAPAMLSPIPEERHESGRESETEAMISARKDRRANSLSVVTYGSFDQVAA